MIFATGPTAGFEIENSPVVEIALPSRIAGLLTTKRNSQLSSVSFLLGRFSGSSFYPATCHPEVHL